MKSFRRREAIALKVFIFKIIGLFSLLCIGAVPANAGGPGAYHGSGGYHGSSGYYGHGSYHGYGGNNGHGNSYNFGITIGPGWGGWGPGWRPVYPYYPYAPYYPYYPAPAVVVPQQPQVYVQQNQQESDYWYYCQNPQGYYPYINSCPGGWMKVVPETVPPGR
jgi:hypothetical protein